MLSDDDIKKMSVLFKPDNKADERNKIIEWLFRLLLGVLVWLAVDMKDDVAQMKIEIQKIATEKVYNERDMELVKQYISKPVFSKQDFETQLAPTLIQINRNSIDINALMQFREVIEKRLTHLELKR